MSTRRLLPLRLRMTLVEPARTIRAAARGARDGAATWSCCGSVQPSVTQANIMTGFLPCGERGGVNPAVRCQQYLSFRGANATRNLQLTGVPKHSRSLASLPDDSNGVLEHAEVLGNERLIAAHLVRASGEHDAP